MVTIGLELIAVVADNQKLLILKSVSMEASSLYLVLLFHTIFYS